MYKQSVLIIDSPHCLTDCIFLTLQFYSPAHRENNKEEHEKADSHSLWPKCARQSQNLWAAHRSEDNTSKTRGTEA